MNLNAFDFELNKREWERFHYFNERSKPCQYMHTSSRGHRRHRCIVKGVYNRDDDVYYIKTTSIIKTTAITPLYIISRELINRLRLIFFFLCYAMTVFILLLYFLFPYTSELQKKKFQ